MPLPSKINSLKFRVSSGTSPNVVTREQQITTANIGSNSIPITDTQIISDFNDKPLGTIFNTSVVASYDDGYSFITNNVSNYVPKPITPSLSLAALTKTTLTSPFSLTPSVTTNSSGLLTFTSSNTSVSTVSGNTATIVGAGTTTITVSLAESPDKVYLPATTSATLIVNKVEPTLSLAALTKTTLTSPFSLIPSLTSNSPGALTFTSSNPSVATISGYMATIVGAGTATINVSVAESAIYTSKTTSATLTVNKVAPSLSLADLTKTTLTSPFSLTPSVTTNSSGLLTFTSSNTSVATVSGNTATIVGAGTATIIVSLAESAIYTSATTSATLTVNKVEPSLSFSLENLDISTLSNPFDLTPLVTTNSSGALSFSTLDINVATISGSMVTPVGTGTATINVSLAESAIYTSKTTSATLIVNSGIIPIIPNEWNQRGGDMYGEADYDRSGYSVSLSADGTIVAIGAPLNDANAYNAGHVRVYKYDATKTTTQLNQSLPNYGPALWNRLGSDIDGNGYASGISVSLSADGTTVAMGSEYNITYIYKYNTNTDNWIQQGQGIVGEGQYDTSGYAVSISADGTIVAIGSYNYSADINNAINSGHVRVFKYDTNTNLWVQLGGNMNGTVTNQNIGISVSISGDGTIVATGGSGDGTDPGVTRVYKYNQNNNTWSQLGVDIIGENNGDYSGVAVSISSDGTTVAIGAYYNAGVNGSNSGHTRIYKYNMNTSSWEQVGGDIDGEAENDYSGNAVSLSSDGTTVAIGGYYNDGNGNNAGQVRVYKYDATKTSAQWNDQSQSNYGPVGWNRVGSDIDGKQANEYNGQSVSLSADGTIVAFGAFGNNNMAGATRVYYYVSQ